MAGLVSAKLKRFLAVMLCAATATGWALGAEIERGQTVLSRDELKAKYARPTGAPFPADNPYSPEKELLGRDLFFDPRLSGSGWISCATCHNPGLAWGDGLPRAIGHGMKTLNRHTPTILNLAWADLLFWDGRAASLEEQALGPMTAPGEMNQDLNRLTSLLGSIPGYTNLFARAFPGQPISPKLVAAAIATFERTVVSAPAPFDRWIAGNELAISEKAKEGFDVFNGKAGCAHCHSEWNFSDNGFHDIGVNGDDVGRGKYVADASVQFTFKTPGLRNITRRAPYMHDGSEATLEKVIDFYDRGGDAKRPTLAREIKPLHLSDDEKAALVEFLKALNSNDPAIRYPELPR